MSTIKDVAKKAGVSIATVSYIVNGTKTVSSETTEKVLKAIEELNYSTNQTAKSFKTGKKNIIAFILPDISNNYFANIIEALEDELSASGYSLILANTKESKEREIKHLKYLTSGIADGIILASTVQNYQEIRNYIPKEFPVVLIDRKLENCPLDVVSVSDKNAIMEGMQKLFESGHTQIGYIGDAPHLSTARERLESYHFCLDCHNLTANPDFIKTASSLTHDAYSLTGELVDAGCNAIVVGNNVMTTDAYCYLIHNQEKCQNVKILGYEHKDLACLFTSSNGLIELNEKEMGIAAGKQILSRIENPKQSQKEIIIYNTYR